MSGGLQRRYEVKRLNDPTGKHEDCRYFVLDPQHDPIALAALEPFIKEREAVAYDRALADGRYLPGIIKDPINAPAPGNPYRENGDDR